MSTDNRPIELTAAQQRYVVTRAERVGVTADEFLEGLVPSADEQGNLLIAAVGGDGVSALEAARRFGLVGVSTGDPEDLATNPDHMQGFGEDDHHTDPS